jgi:hypothetical protein
MTQGVNLRLIGANYPGITGLNCSLALSLELSERASVRGREPSGQRPEAMRPTLSRHGVLIAAAACSLQLLTPPVRRANAYEPSRLKVAWGPFKDLSSEEIEALDLASRKEDAGVLLPSGVRVIDIIVGTGPQPTKGTRVYAHYKVSVP